MGARQNGLTRCFSIAKILLKLCGCTCWYGTLLVICLLGRHPIFHVSLFYCKDPDQTAQMHMHAYAYLELCWPDVSLESLYISFKSFWFCKSPHPPIFHIFLLQRPRSNCMNAHYTELSNIFDNPFHLR